MYLSPEFGKAYYYYQYSRKIPFILESLIYKKKFFYKSKKEEEKFSLGIFACIHQEYSSKQSLPPTAKGHDNELKIWYLEKKLGEGSYGCVFKTLPLEPVPELTIQIGGTYLLKSKKKNNIKIIYHSENKECYLQDKAISNFYIISKEKKIPLLEVLGERKAYQFIAILRNFKTSTVTLENNLSPLFIDIRKLEKRASALKAIAFNKLYFIKLSNSASTESLIRRWIDKESFLTNQRFLIFQKNAEYSFVYKNLNHRYQILSYNGNIEHFVNLKPDTFYNAKNYLSEESILDIINLYINYDNLHIKEKKLKDSAYKETLTAQEHGTFKSFYKNPDFYLVELKYASGTELWEVIQKIQHSSNSAYSFSEKVSISISIGLAILDFYKKTKRYHNDISNANIMINRKENRWICRLIDYGLSSSHGSHYKDIILYLNLINHLFLFDIYFNKAGFIDFNQYPHLKRSKTKVLDNASNHYLFEYEVFQLVFKRKNNSIIEVISTLEDIQKRYLESSAPPTISKAPEFITNIIDSSNCKISFIEKMELLIELSGKLLKQNASVTFDELYIKEKNGHFSASFPKKPNPHAPFSISSLVLFFSFAQSLFLFNIQIKEKDYSKIIDFNFINKKFLKNGIKVLDPAGKYFFEEKLIYDYLNSPKNLNIYKSNESFKVFTIEKKNSFKKIKRNCFFFWGENTVGVYEDGKIQFKANIPIAI